MSEGQGQALYTCHSTRTAPPETGKTTSSPTQDDQSLAPQRGRKRQVGLNDQDQALCNAVTEMQQGLVDADLGGYVVKKRVALPGQGKRGGARTLVATQLASRWFFLYGFSKNERANIDKDELKVLQEVAKELLALSDANIAIALEAGEMTEVCHDNDQT